MKKIINAWREIPEYNCFACSTTNPIGLHMEFYEDGEDIVSFWKPQKNYEGWKDTLHGGIISTLIDDVCAWVVNRKMQTYGFTTSLNVKFRKAVSSHDPQITIRARAVKQVHNLLSMHAEVFNSKGELCDEAEVTYFMMSQEKAREVGFRRCDVEE